MQASKIKKRDEIVSQMRFLFFGRFGFVVSEEDYSIFNSFFKYERESHTHEDYEKLCKFISLLKDHGKTLMKRVDIWEIELDFWLEFAKKSIV